MTKKREWWPGGYVRRTGKGDRRYIIERWAHGRRVHVSTGCSTRDGAMRELARFEADPIRYRPGGGKERLELDAALVLEYRAHQTAKGLTAEWTTEVARCLADWTVVLAGRDLRGLDLHQDLKPALTLWKGRIPHRIKAIKGLFRWLVEERGLVKDSDDATRRLRVPQATPEKWRRPKVVPREDVQAVLRVLPQGVRDVLHLQTATAWHVSEVRRFAAGGEVVPPLNVDGVLAVLLTRHKSGEIHRTPLQFQEHVNAARRLLERGGIPNRMTISRAMRAACDQVGVPRFGLGQIRHSVLTWGIEWGAELKRASEFAGHKSESTTRKFYADVAVPAPVIPIFRFDTETG